MPTLPLTEEQLRPITARLGFTERIPGRLYYCTGLDAYVSFNVWIDAATGEYETLVMDENFGQPWYYMSSIEDFRVRVQNAVDAIVADFTSAGLPIVHDHNEYHLR